MSESKLIETSGKMAAIDKDLLASCIHCGLCLPACPTYLATGREMENPRGRIYLLSKWQSGELEMTDRAAGHIDSCLGCLGCQTVCPSGVNYEEILNQARPQLAKRRNWFTRFLMRFAFQTLLPNYVLLRLSAFFLRFWQMFMGRDGFKIAMGEPAPGATPGLTQRLIEWESFTPEVPLHVPLPKKVTPKQEGEGSKHTQLFCGCVMDVFYNSVNHASIRLLLRQGNSVDVPRQTCCGALAYHAGENDIALALAKKNIDYFGYSNTPIVVTSAGCGAMLKHYVHLLEDDRDYAGKAIAFSNRIYDVTEVLAAGEFPEEPKALDETTTYHAACHLAHAQNVRDEPIALLKKLDSDPEHKLVPLPEQEHCCGSAGIYNLLNTRMSLKVLDRKLDFIEKTGAKTVVTTNPGCMLQLQAGIANRKLDVEVKHLIEVLDEAYSTEGS